MTAKFISVRKISLVVWIIVNLTLAAWSNDLVQINRETLFLSKSGNQSYDLFKSVVDERRVLAVKLELPTTETMSEQQFQEVRLFYESLKSKYSGDEFAWMDFQDIYNRAIGDQSFAKVSLFANEQKNLLMPLLGPHHSGFLLMLDQKVEDSVIAKIIHDIASHQWVQPFKTYMGGLPYINMKLNEYAEDIKFTLIPLMVVISVLITGWLIRNFRCAVLLVIPSVFSLVQSLSFAKWLYGSLNMVTAVVPLMMFVINLMISFHLFYGLRLAGSFSIAWKVKRIPLVLSILTMAVGFLTNYVSEIPVIKQFAVVSTVAVIASSIMSIIGIMLFEPWLMKKSDEPELRVFDKKILGSFWSNRAVCIFSVVIIVLAFWAAPRLELVTDATRYFPTSSGLREAIKKVETDFLGTPAFEILVKNSERQSFTFEQYRQLYEVESEVSKVLGRKYKVFSLGQLMTEANTLFSGQQNFPPQRITWAMLMGGLPKVVKGAFPLGEVYRVSLMGTTMNSDEFNLDLEKVKILTKKYSDLGFQVEINGLNYHLMNAQESLVRVMLEGFAITLLVVTILFGLTFRKFKTVGKYLLASLLPMGAGIIAIYILGFSLNIATVMTFSIALGMIVDNSFHMTWNIERGRSFDDYYADTILPIVGSGFLLGLGFVSFALNGFLPIRQVGVLVAVMLVVGIVCSLFVLRPSSSLKKL